MADAPSPRALLRTEPAPTGAAPMVVTLRGGIGRGDLTLSYVPDRDILVATSFDAYLKVYGHLGFRPPKGWEAFTAAIAEDIANELVPRWHRVTLRAGNEIVTVEDRQPGWDHPSLLTTVAPLRFKR